jgi:hypothetical protein
MLVKTYPVPSKKYGETVCCAGVDAATGKWVRMYPVNFRSLAEYARFSKWQFVQASWTASADDGRPESRKVFQDTIRAGRKLAAGGGWAERRRWLDPLVDQSIEALRQEQLQTKKSLGVIRPRVIKRLIIRPTDPWDSESRASLVQLSLEWTKSPKPSGDLEMLPYDFLYEFECNDADCPGHTMEIFDWELGQAFRNFRRLYGPAGWEAKLRQKYETELPSRDLHLLLGTHHRWGNWLIVGVIAPPYPEMTKRQRRAARQLGGEGEPMTLPLIGFEAEQRDLTRAR